MRVRLFSNDIETAVNPFISRFVGNVGAAIAASLKAPRAAAQLEYCLEGELVRLQVDGTQISLDRSQGFARSIVRDTLRGMVCHLKGVDPEGIIRIQLDFSQGE